MSTYIKERLSVKLVFNRIQKLDTMKIGGDGGNAKNV